MCTVSNDPEDRFSGDVVQASILDTHSKSTNMTSIALPSKEHGALILDLM